MIVKSPGVQRHRNRTKRVGMTRSKSIKVYTGVKIDIQIEI